MEFVTAGQVRDFLNEQNVSGNWSDAVIGSNIRTASHNLQRWTHRQFEAVSGTRRFSTQGRSSLVIPDLRSVSSVSLDGSALEADATYWLVPDRYEQTVYVGLVLRRGDGRGWDPRWYLSDPDWFDRGLDLEPSGWGITPNDLVIVSTQWGWDPLPAPLLHATKVLAGYYTVRPSSLLADVRVTAEGALLAYRSLPHEVKDFVTDWSLGSQASAVGIV